MLLSEKHRFAEDNIGLLQAYFTKHKIHDEDIQATLGLAFWRAVLTYDDTREATFSTYAYKVLGWEMYAIIHSQQAQKRILPKGETLWHLEYLTATKDGDKEASELIGCIDESIDQFECDDVVERLLPYLQVNEQKILKLSYAGYKAVEIAKIMGCSRQNISARQKRMHKFVKRVLWKEMMCD